MPERPHASPLAAAWVIFKKEGIDLLRDRRAVFFGVVLPVLLYPVLYLGLSSAAGTDPIDRPLRIGVSGGWVPFLECFREKALVPEALPLDAEGPPDAEGLIDPGKPLDPKGGPDQEGGPWGVGAVPDETLALSVTIDEPEGGGIGGPAPVLVRVRYRSTSPDSIEALRRIRSCLEQYRDQLLDARFRQRGLLSTTRFIELEQTDLATAAERSRSVYAKILPVILVLLLLSGGSFIALDLVAGEKERGTLETLYVNPVPTDGIVWGKFLALLVGSLICGLVNVLGLSASLWIGARAGVFPHGLEGAPPQLPDPATLALLALAVAPLVVLTSAVLLLVSTRARSFREAQNYLLPLTLVTVALLLLAVAPGARLSSVVCVVPFAGSALAIREVLEGHIASFPFLLACASTLLYGTLILARCASLLRREDVILDLEPPYSPADALAEARSKRAMAFSAFMLLFLYYAASSLQARDPYQGVAITLWVLVLGPALVYPLIVRAPYRETLGLRRAAVGDFLLAAPLGVASVVLVTAYMALQDQFLHTPRALDEVFREFLGKADLGPLAAFWLFAISPGICEELLWRGAVQGELEPRGRPVRTVLVVGLLFGLFHQSIHRLVPTALLGAVLAVVRHRSGSVFPCMVLHALYNGILVALSRNEAAGSVAELEAILLHPLAIALAGACLLGCLSAVGRSGKGRRHLAGSARAGAGT